MARFTIPAGTTNRHQWHKDAAKAIGRVTSTFNQLRQIYGTIGGEQRESLVSVFGGGGNTNTAAVAIYNELGERFKWQITRENAAEVAAAFTEALPKCRETIPVEDNRKTPEEQAEQAARLAKNEQERKEAAAVRAAAVDAIARKLRAEYPEALGPDSGKSSHARAAANLKAELVRQGLRVSVKSDSFSMGDSVHAKILTPDLPPERRKAITEFCDRFQYGSFDGMTDSYNIDHSDEREAWGIVLGQSKYISVDFEQSDECRAAIRAFLADSEADSMAAHSVWSGVHPAAKHFWPQWIEDHPAAEPEPEPEAGTQGAGYRIEKHKHTKKGFIFWLVIPAARVERDEFERLRESCKAAGGWYSRKWGKTPGGFAFKEQERAGAWAIQEFRDGPPTPPSSREFHETAPEARREKALADVRQSFEAERQTCKERRTQKAENFRLMADKIDAEVQAKRGEHLENTPKRQREGMSRRIEADRLERTAQALRALADLHERAEVPEALAKYTSKKAVYDALGVRTTSAGYYHIAPTDEHSDTSPGAAALWALIDGKSEEQERADRLAEMLAGLPKIPGYFPTPPDLVAEMIDRAGIEAGHAVLEPSAGSGAILDEIEQLHHEPGIVVALEINQRLCEILKAKGYDARPIDFMEYRGAFRYDRIVMNPPFENMQDVDHVRHAFGLLKPGGRLVAIMSPGPFFRGDRKAGAFREWLHELEHEVEDLEPGTFKASGTEVGAKLVVIDKPDELAEYRGHDYGDDDEPMSEAQRAMNDKQAGVPPQGGQMALF